MIRESLARDGSVSGTREVRFLLYAPQAIRVWESAGVSSAKLHQVEERVEHELSVKKRHTVKRRAPTDQIGASMNVRLQPLSSNHSSKPLPSPFIIQQQSEFLVSGRVDKATNTGGALSAIREIELLGMGWDRVGAYCIRELVESNAGLSLFGYVDVCWCGTRMPVRSRPAEKKDR